MPTFKSPLQQAVLKILTALVRILMRNGMAYGEFDQLVRKSFVDVAFDEFGVEGKKQTASNVAILTGLNRKEVTKFRDIDSQASSSTNSRQYNRLVRVLGGWVNDPAYLDQNGNPRDLDFEGNASFSELVKNYSGDMPVVAMQKALTQAGNISVLADNKMRLLSRAYLPTDEAPEKLTILGTDTRQLIQTIDHNLTSPADALRFQRKASNRSVHPESVPVIEQYVKKKSQTFLEEVDYLLSQHETDRADSAELSIAVFYHQSTDTDSKS
jgi:hypothetical protein